MKKPILTLLTAISILTGSAQAHLGWTLDDCSQKWGPPKSEVTDDGVLAYYWNRKNYGIEVIVMEGFVNCICYYSGSRSFLASHIDNWLAASASKGWEVYDDGGKATIKTWRNLSYDCYAVFKLVPGTKFYRLQVATNAYSDLLKAMAKGSLQ